ncbi:hypothetical protein GWK47_034325 [Chionoecetes opilio]|uniref:Uncharacterized protein n=1 Tax=Chionoecetes opilio TaxID=41210 RepID=A0A8J5CP61_CHIOP|nr:hypothetical protein GWK47_034325 [Chionoecetes opilio]
MEEGSRLVTWLRHSNPTRTPLPFHKVYLQGWLSRLIRLRLGYRCASQILQTAPDQCPYCFEIEDDTLHHYIIRCPGPRPSAPCGLDPGHRQRSSGTSDSLCLNSNARRSLSWSGYGDELCWVALWLARATGDHQYIE